MGLSPFLQLLSWCRPWRPEKPGNLLPLFRSRSNVTIACSVMQAIVTRTASVAREVFFPALLQNLAIFLDVPCVLASEIISQQPLIAFPAPVRYKLKAQTLALYYSARTSSDRKPL
ncbi:hypothetical protein JOY44_20350 [Phormidium sp. CLA17]|uniref:hypothetical protein n=1 Tax=Leptolyngbya sp. Cla-17 TaxID=2803751 RepID=UPI00149245DD|nr:hypothetical protein [Leptolyngbya sp. Cla-17]MBM0743944.1 hypothetical protein [Leptolyngbya sp. Cla-17]